MSKFVDFMLSIDFAGLENFPLSQKQKLPIHRGVYVVLDEFLEVKYIGSADNIRERFLAHKVTKDWLVPRGVVYCLPVKSPVLLGYTELALVTVFQPPFNTYLKRGNLQLLELLFNAGVSKSELAGAIGVNETTIRNWLTFRSVPALNPYQYQVVFDLLKCNAAQFADVFRRSKAVV